MGIWAIVPVKPLRQAKSRLGSVLDESERAELSEMMLVRTLQALREVPGIEQTLVVSRDPEALTLARDHGARTVAERGSPELNRALTRATDVAVGNGALSVLVLPADLPELTHEAIDKLLARAPMPPSVVIAPDRHRRGTNALLVTPPGTLKYEFGPDSFRKHVEQAEKSDVEIDICEHSALGFDLDAPEDLKRLKTKEGP